MDGTAEPECRFQFRLRKLLSWTTMVAILLAVLRMMGFWIVDFAIVLGGAAILAIVRSVFLPRHARVIWMLVVAFAGEKGYAGFFGSRHRSRYARLE